MTSVKLRSWAKLNLTLDVLDNRGDGYHELDSVVQVISLFDELEFVPASAGVIQITADADWLPLDSSNTIFRAVDVFKEWVGAEPGIRCAIRKHIPAQAGLGGGSSNAAATITALNVLYNAGLDIETMTGLAAKVGSDAALFIAGGTVRMRGRGDVLEPLPDAPCLSFVIVKPDEGVSTADAYSLLDQGDHDRRRLSQDAVEAVMAGQRDALVDCFGNDFDGVISERLESVRLAKQALKTAGARSAMLTGSGSAVFGVFNTEADAASAAGTIPPSVGSVYVVRSMSRRESSLSEVSDVLC